LREAEDKELLEPVGAATDTIRNVVEANVWKTRKREEGGS
jgi:hypothetical protein